VVGWQFLFPYPILTYNPMMPKNWWTVLLLPILIVASALRLTGNGWDRYEHYHPDERYIAWVATSIEAPTLNGDALNPQKSTFNPYYWPPNMESSCIANQQDARRDFAYGHLPLYLGVLATRIVERTVPQLFNELPPTCQSADGKFVFSEFDRIAATGRALTALFDVATVIALFLLGRALFDEKVGILAATFLTLNVMHIQQSHFFTVDVYMTFFVVFALYNMVLAVQRRSVWRISLAAILCGLAVGSKFSAVLLALPLLLAWWWGRGAVLRSEGRRWTILRSLAGLGLTTGVAFGLTNPFALLDWTCQAITPATNLLGFAIPEINWRSCYLLNVAAQREMVGGGTAFPFVRQYVGTQPFLYFAEMQLRWGMGFALGILAIVGFGWAIISVLRSMNWWSLRQPDKPLFRQKAQVQWVVLAWCVPFFLLTGSFFVKFMRYLLPLTPFLMLYAAVVVLAIRGRWLRLGVLTVTVVLTGLYALAFVGIYQQPHPWIVASQWIYTNVPLRSTIASEKWGDRLPSLLIDDATIYSIDRFGYQYRELTWLSGINELKGNTLYVGDSEAKLAENLRRVAASDYLIVDSNRVYGVVSRLPDEFPNSSKFYQPLFSGELGFEPVFVTGRFPRIGEFYLQPDFFGWPNLRPPRVVRRYLDGLGGITLGRADESFTLYDQSLVMIFENVDRISAEELQEIVNH
jgi:hypothetical protein